MKKILIITIIILSLLTNPIITNSKTKNELTKEELQIQENNKSGLIITAISTFTIIIIISIYKKKKIKLY